MNSSFVKVLQRAGAAGSRLCLSAAAAAPILPRASCLSHARAFSTSSHTGSHSTPSLSPAPSDQLLSAATTADKKLLHLQLKSGKQMSFSTLWLWYNADMHRQRDSGQRTLDAVGIRRAPAVASAGISSDGSSLDIQWSNSTSSSFPLSWLQDQEYSREALEAARVRATPPSLTAPSGRPCIGKETVPSFDYEEIMASEQAVWRWLQGLNEYGLTVIRNAPLEARTVLKAAGRIAEPMKTIYGEVWDVAVMPKPINIAYAPVGLDLHVDLVYYESPPGLQLLHCQRFDKEVVGGESTFMDGFLAAEELRRWNPEAFATLTRIPATFQKIHYAREWPAHIVAQRPHIILDRFMQGGGPASKSDCRGDITGIFWAPPFEGPLRVPAEDVQPYYEAYAAFADLIQQLQSEGRHRVEYRMEPGDISVFNNRRMLHGRRSFSASTPSSSTPAAAEGAVPSPQRILQGCYVNIDDYKSRFSYLSSRYGNIRDVKRVANQCWY